MGRFSIDQLIDEKWETKHGIKKFPVTAIRQQHGLNEIYILKTQRLE